MAEFGDQIPGLVQQIEAAIDGGVVSVNGETGAVNLKTVGGVSLIGSGDVPIGTGPGGGSETTTTLGALINGATAKAAPVDADMLPLMDSAAANVVKKLSWANVKATLKTYFDTLYQPVHAALTAFAALSPSNDDILQRKSGAWTNRTPAQLKTDLSLNNVNNTSDADKPVSTAQASALTLKANIASPTFTGTVSGITSAMVGLGNVANADTTTTANITDSTNKRFATDDEIQQIGKTSGFNTGDETGATIRTKLGITTLSGSNTGDQDLSGYAPIASPTFTGTVSGITKAMVGLGSVVDADTTTTANITDATNKRFVTDAEKTKLSNTSGTNTGDETTATIKTKLGITTLSGSNTGDQDLSGKQDVLVSGTNIKTVNGSSLLGAGNLTISGSGGVSDGDKGEITVSSSGAVWQINPEIITNDKLVGMNTKTYKGRTSSGKGEPEDVPVATLKTDLALVKGDVGLGNVDNTSDASKFASPVLTGTPTAPTPAAGTNTTQLATAAFVQGAVPNSSYRSLLDCTGSHTAARAAGTYGMGQGDPIAISGTGTLYPLNVIYIDSADYPTVDGKAAKLRIRAQIYCNDVAPFTGTFVVGLHPVTRPSTSGGAGLAIYTIGTAVTGSTATLTNPAADSSNILSGADFALPANGHYVVGIVTSAAMAASSHVHISAILQMRNN